MKTLYSIHRGASRFATFHRGASRFASLHRGASRFASLHRGASRFAILFSALAVLATATSARAETEEYNLVVGGQQTFPAEGIQNYSVSNPKLLQVVVSTDARTLVAKALKPGTTTLLLIHENKAEPDRTITFNIFARNPKAVMSELNDILRNFPDVQVRQNGPQIVLQGSVQTPQEEQRLKELEKNYGGQVISVVTVGPSGSRRNVMIRLDLHYVQVRRRVQRRLGLHYPSAIGTSGGGGNSQAQGPQFLLSADLLGGADGKTFITQAQYSIVTDLLPWLDVTEASGYIRVSRTDSIVTENGSRAAYKDGSEIYLRLVGGLAAAKLEKVFFGSELTVSPRLSANNDSVSLDISADLTQRDNAGAQDGIPGRLIDHVETTVHLPIGQSVMIAGVKSKANGRTTTGLPWLNRIPVLGYLFGSEDYEKEDADGLLFITPTLIQASSPENVQRIDDVLKHFEDP